jgi:two-component system response regulator AlgR
MKILIVDDEALARAHLGRLLQDIGTPYQAAGEADNGATAIQLCEQLEADLVLLDISMPGMDGLTAASQLARLAVPPAVIFTTAYDEYALEAFDQNAIDYLLKPIRRERLEQALTKASNLTRPQLQALQQLQQETEPEYISVSYRGTLQRIPVNEILYFRAEHKYVLAQYGDSEVLLEESLKSLEERFGERFMRIHRNALVATERLMGLRKSTEGVALVKIDGSERQLEVSRRHLAAVRRLLHNRK